MIIKKFDWGFFFIKKGKVKYTLVNRRLNGLA